MTKILLQDVDHTGNSPLLKSMDEVKKTLQKFLEEVCKKKSESLLTEKLKDVSFKCFIQLTKYQLQVSKS